MISLKNEHIESLVLVNLDKPNLKITMISGTEHFFCRKTKDEVAEEIEMIKKSNKEYVDLKI